MGGDSKEIPMEKLHPFLQVKSFVTDVTQPNETLRLFINAECLLIGVLELQATYIVVSHSVRDHRTEDRPIREHLRWMYSNTVLHLTCIRYSGPLLLRPP